MTQRRQFLATNELQVDDESSEPAYLQIYRQLRLMILDGRLPPGARLTSSRSYSGQLGRARNTVAAAYDLLLSEGLIQSRRGSGTFVADAPIDYSRAFTDEGPAMRVASATDEFRLSAFGEAILKSTDWPIGGGRQFDPEGPDHQLFPFKEWGRLLRRVWQKPSARVLFDFDPAGYRPLREQLAQYLAANRAVRCTADDIILTSGSLHGLDLVARLLVNPGHSVLFEDPGYTRGRALFTSMGADLVSVPVDRSGMCVEAGIAQAPAARLAYVTPSRQYPTGSVMTVERRQRLLAWAREHDAWIFEDDYDSDFRLVGQPLRSIQGLDDNNRVIYAGSLSKVMFPGLRVGYLVLPPGLQPLMSRARRALDLFPSSIAQSPLVHFFEDGYFAAYVNKMQHLYARRRQVLMGALDTVLGDLLAIEREQGGIEICTFFRPGSPCGSDRQIVQEAVNLGMRLQPLSQFYYREPEQQGLIFGLAILDETKLEANLGRLRSLMVGRSVSAQRKA